MVAEHIHVVGREGTYHDGRGVEWPVYIQSVREAYGRVDYLVSPLDGEGSRWVYSGNVDLDTERTP